MHFISRLLAAVFCFLMISCSKGGGGATDDTGDTQPHVYNPSDLLAPVITLQTPAPNQVLTGGPIQVNGTVSDDLGLYRGTIQVIRDQNGVEEKKQVYEIHGLKSYTFTLTNAPAVTAPTDFTIVVFFEDHGYNGATQTVKVTLTP